MDRNLISTALSIASGTALALAAACSSSSPDNNNNSTADGSSGGNGDSSTGSSSGGSSGSSSGAQVTGPDGAGADSSGGSSSDAADAGGTYVLVDDMEGTGNGPIKLNVAATLPGSTPGSWYDVVSLTQPGGVITPPNSLVPVPYRFTMLPTSHPTYNGIVSMSAAHVACTISDQYGFCQEGFGFAQVASDAGTTTMSDAAPDAASDAASDAVSDAASDATPPPVPTVAAQFDISQYKQLTFWLMAGGDGGAQSIKVLFPDVNSDPRGGICGGDAGVCYDSWSYPVPPGMFTGAWSQVTINIPGDLVPQGFGYEAAAYDPHHAFGIAFQVDGPALAADSGGIIVPADFWVDDIYFVK